MYIYIYITPPHQGLAPSLSIYIYIPTDEIKMGMAKTKVKYLQEGYQELDHLESNWVFYWEECLG